MTTTQVPGGVVHDLPADLGAALSTNSVALAAWQSITPLARNQFICWARGREAADNARAAHPPYAGGAGRGPASPVLLAGLQAPRARRRPAAGEGLGQWAGPDEVTALLAASAPAVVHGFGRPFRTLTTTEARRLWSVVSSHFEVPGQVAPNQTNTG